MAYNKTRKYYGIITCNSLTARKEPNEKAQACQTFGALKKYEVVDICDICENGWFYIKTNSGRFGFCPNKGIAKRKTISQIKAYAAVMWGKDIGADNSFHYGVHKKDGGWANHFGCYFCGTNSKTGAKVKAGAKYEDQLKTYCCNPFATACYCHGASKVKLGNDVSKIVNCKVGDKRFGLAGSTNKVLNNIKYFKKITKPTKITELQVGDILLSPTHAMIYSGGGKIIEATGGDDNIRNSVRWKKSIGENTCSSSKWKSVTKIYRYIGE